MTKPLNQTLQHIQPSGIRKFFNIANEMDDVISLGVGEPDFPTPWEVRYETIHAIRNGKSHYTSNAGLPELRLEIQNYLKRKYQLAYDKNSEMIVTVGGSEAIDLAARALINPGDEVICLDPSYVSYAPTVQLAGGVVVPLPLQNDNNFIVQPEELEEKITDKTKAVILNYPNNPTGAAATSEELERLVPIIKKYDLYVITDEIYSEIWYRDEPFISIANFEGMKERTIYINGFAKSFAMTGWRLGYVCGPREVIEQMLKIHQYTILAAPTLSQHAGVTALRESDDAVERMREAYEERRNFLINQYKKMDLPCFLPQGAFYTFPDIREFDLTSEEFAFQLLEEEKVAVVPGSAFGEAGEGFLRVSYAYSINELTLAMEKLAQFIGRLRNQK